LVVIEKDWILTFADFLVIVAKDEREMKEMMKTLGKYVRKKKKLEVNLEKMKMMVFNKGKRKSENWEGRKIKRINKFKYLGYTFNERATNKTYQRDSEESKEGIEMRLGKRGEKGGGDFRRRIIFESMIESILMYGVEI
jgi:hypothetical protein